MAETDADDEDKIKAADQARNDSQLRESSLFEENYALLHVTITDIIDPLIQRFVEENIFTFEEVEIELQLLLNKCSALLKDGKTRCFNVLLEIMKEFGGQGTRTLADHILNRLSISTDKHLQESKDIEDSALKLAKEVNNWCKRKRIRNSKCIGILYARFHNNKFVFVIAMSGTGKNIDGDTTDYKKKWSGLESYLKTTNSIPPYVIAEFDSVHKACLGKQRKIFAHTTKALNAIYNMDCQGKTLTEMIEQMKEIWSENMKKNGIVTNEFFEDWLKRLKSLVKQWSEKYKKLNSNGSHCSLEDFKKLVDEKMKDPFLIQLEELEIPNPRERYNFIVEFIVDCSPTYDDQNMPVRMQVAQLLLTKTPEEISAWFENQLQSNQDLACYKQTFLTFIHDFQQLKEINCLYVGFSEDASIRLWEAYKLEYDRKGLPTGYTTVSMIWGNILAAPVPTPAFVDMFIQCAEDNALCKLVSYITENKDLLCKAISWFAYDRDCNIKYLCPFCEIGFQDRLTKVLEKLGSTLVEISINGKVVSCNKSKCDDEVDCYTNTFNLQLPNLEQSQRNQHVTTEM